MHTPDDTRALPILVINNESVCLPKAHVWPVDFASGDRCRCGALRLVRGADGELITQAPKEDDDASGRR